MIVGVDTATLPVLKNEEMRKLFVLMQDGDLSAREELINGNIRLVLSVIQKFKNRGEDADDLFQVGCIGLMKAIDHFDLNRGVAFSTFAVPNIDGTIRRYLRENKPLRVSRSLRDIAYKALQVKENWVSDYRREPTAEDMAQQLGVPAEDVTFALDAVQHSVSLFEPIYNDGGNLITVMDHIGDEKNKESQWIEELALHEALGKLGPTKKDILSLRILQGKTQREVAEELGVSQVQVSRLEKAAIKEMNKHIEFCRD